MLRPVALLTVWFAIGLTICRGEVLNKTVQTEYGAVRGYKAVDGDYFAFLGIPYAAPPTGHDRFKAPLPPQHWEGTFEANRTVVCPQKGHGDEDCLVINVFTPLMIERPLPVLFYIHGGSFLIGNGPTKGVHPLINENIVVVTINYRLGALGFLCLGVPEAPGNAGLKDQVAALRWVQDNIENFGGNPRLVTIYGMSAGAASVELLVLSKLSRGLFKRAIVESGASSAVWVTNANPIATAEELAKWNHVDNSDSLSELLNFYTNVTANKLSKTNMDYYNTLVDGTMGFVPCVENRIQDVVPFLTEAPHDVLVKGDYRPVPMMFVYTTLEGLFLRSEEFYKMDYAERMEKNFIEFVPADLCLNNTRAKEIVGGVIKDFYFGKSPVSERFMDYLNFFGDYMVMGALLNSTEFHARKSNVYLLEFGYKGRMGSYDAFYDDTIDTAGHGDFIKHAILIRDIDNFGDGMTVRRVSNLISNFVKHGDPIPKKNQLLPLSWPKVVPVPRKLQYLYLNKEFEVRENPMEYRRELWDTLYAKYRRQMKPVTPKVLCRCGCTAGCNEKYMCKSGRYLLKN